MSVLFGQGREAINNMWASEIHDGHDKIPKSRVESRDINNGCTTPLGAVNMGPK